VEHHHREKRRKAGGHGRSFAETAITGILRVG
jgi:hypothetical protein